MTGIVDDVHLDRASISHGGFDGPAKKNKSHRIHSDYRKLYNFENYFILHTISKFILYSTQLGISKGSLCIHILLKRNKYLYTFESSQFFISSFFLRSLLLHLHSFSRTVVTFTQRRFYVQKVVVSLGGVKY